MKTEEWNSNITFNTLFICPPVLHCQIIHFFFFFALKVNSDGTEYILDDDECPLSILMNHPTSRGKRVFFFVLSPC
jgi:hypothetical protein